MHFKGFIFVISKLRVEGIALFPFILLRPKSPGSILINHERIHIRQQLEMGVLPFYIWYAIEFFVRLAQYRNRYLAYFHISFEQEAYRNEADLNYLKKRRAWAFRKYL